MDPTTLEGTLARILFSNEETAWSVVRLAVAGEDEEVTAVGNLLGVREGEQLRLTGKWIDDRKYGRQFQVEAYLSVKPSTLKGIERYLASGMVEGIGPAMAKRLVDHFGQETLDVIEKHHERLTEVEGIGKVRAKRIREAWAEQSEVKEVMIFLQSHGVSPAYAVRIWQRYGKRALGLVRENPYRLALEIFGIGFKKADQIAQSIGFELASPERAEAGTLHVLFETAEEGHTFVPRAELIARTHEILGIDPILVETAIEKLAADARVRVDRESIYMAALHQAETNAAEAVKLMLQAPPRTASIDLAELEAGLAIELAPEQRAAIAAAQTKRLVVVTGGPGTGKTTIVKAILRLLQKQGRKVLLAAPTGRAAKRLSEATGEEAKTIHRLLEFDPKQRAFAKDAADPLEADTLIVDEVSMVDILLFANLVSALPPKASLVLVGDVDQLPSVGPGRVLDDIIASGRAEVIRLQQIFRQAERSLIVVNAHRINEGKLPLLDVDPERPQDFYLIERSEPERVLETIEEVVARRIPSRFKLDPVDDVQVLTPMHKGPLGAVNLNHRLQSLLNPNVTDDFLKRGPYSFKAGDKVMQTKNDYTLGVFNGDLGRVLSVDVEDKKLVARFDDRTVTFGPSELDTLTLAYACSIHKSQGSEYPAVVIPVSTQHYVMLHRNLFYTGVTRGRRLVVLVGTKRALQMAVENEQQLHRHSGLADRLRLTV
jgi:exodeoxyribonuclease V alpha subunit